MDMNRIKSDEYASVCRIAENTFIRNRKMPLQDLLLSMINRKGLTLTLELRNYMKTAHPGTEISKPGYLKQRMKLNPDVFLDLYHYHNKTFIMSQVMPLITDILFLPQMAPILIFQLPKKHWKCLGHPAVRTQNHKLL